MRLVVRREPDVDNHTTAHVLRAVGCSGSSPASPSGIKTSHQFRRGNLRHGAVCPLVALNPFAADNGSSHYPDCGSGGWECLDSEAFSRLE